MEKEISHIVLSDCSVDDGCDRNVCKTDIRLTERIIEPMKNNLTKNNSTQLTKYDDRMRQEEKKYSRLLTELNKAHCFNLSDQHKGGAKISGTKFDLTEPLNSKFNVNSMMDELLLSALETTSLTDDEVRHGCGLTMEQVVFRHKRLPTMEKDDYSIKNSTQQSIAFQYTLSVQGQKTSRSSMIKEIREASGRSSESGGCESTNVDRIWLEVGGPYSNYSECDSTSAINPRTRAKPEI